MKQVIKSFSDLTTEELYKIYRLRCEVFIVEQHCHYLDVDDADLVSTHVWLQDFDGEILAYARVVPQGVTFDKASIGRIISRKRRSGLGTQIVNTCIDYIFNDLNQDSIKIEAQAQAQGFYEKLGFVQTSEPFNDAGVMHIEMVLNRP